MKASKSVSSKQVVKEFKNAMPDFIDTPSERCCGAACNQPARDNELKLIGAREFNRLLQSKLVLTVQQKHFFNVLETEYHESLVD